MAGYSYNRSRYRSPSLHTQMSELRESYGKQIDENEALKTEIQRLTTLVTELQKHCQWMNEQLKFQEAENEQ